MFYQINKENGYIHSIVKGVMVENANCTEAEYFAVKEALDNAPTAPDDFYYRLKESLEWELCELIINEGEQTATETDYKNALEELG